MDTSQNTGKKRTTLIVALVACLVLAVGAGVFAWFSTQDTKTNTLVANEGVIKPPVIPDKTDPTQPDKDDTVNNDGYITETEWPKDGDVALNKNAVVSKNPNMGVGEGSVPAYVFAMVENNLPNGAYFVLGDGWEPVSGFVTEYQGDKHSSIGVDAKTYTKGLFVYVGKTPGVWSMLAPQPSAKAAYTGELFDKVYTNATFDSTEIKGTNNTIKVSAYFAAASSDNEYVDTNKTQLKDEYKDEIKKDVQAWAKPVAPPLP